MIGAPGAMRSSGRRIGAAILCGGRSTRMGRDKATLTVDGSAMAARVAAALREGGCDPVIGVGGDPVALRRIGVDTVADLAPGEGPLGGIITALTALTALPGCGPNGVVADRSADRPDRVDAVFVAACDLPWLTADTVAAVCDGLAEHDGADVAVAVGDRREPLCAVWTTSALPVLLATFDSGVRAVHRVLDRFDVVEVMVDASTVTNVNSPAELVRDPQHPRHTSKSR